ncbi:MAG: permease-like cell division protein FtsX [Patescibacteria group bacterium]
MIITKLRRTIKSGAVSFWRNSSVSLASVLIMTVTLTVISMILFFGVVMSSTLETIKNKVDINVYFIKSAPEDEMLALAESLKQMPEISTVDYISRKQAYDTFRARHEGEEATLQALDEIGENPLPASLNIKAKDPSQYDTIVEALKGKEVAVNDDGIIDKINYTKNKEAIDAITRIIAASNKLGFLIALFFAAVSILITFNTVRLAIYIFREEISVMRLVGASETYIRGPFVTVGILYGVVSAVVTILILLPLTHSLGAWTDKLGTGMNLFAYYQANLPMIILSLVVAGTVLGAISSYLAIRRYLKV